ncbi:MAG TPA: ThuA domain-containing protein [Longimicrobiaceae bacterium]
MPRSLRFRRVVRAVASLCAMAMLAAGPAAAQAKKIVFLAGPKDHGAPGRHEYEKDLRVLAASLESSPNLRGVTTEVYVGAAPRDLAIYRDAAAIVIHSSSDRLETETHPLFPPDPNTNHRTYDAETLAFLAGIDSLAARGMGVVVLHYANWVENWHARGRFLAWTGGLWVQMASRNPVDQWAMQPAAPEHPVLRGITPWTYRDEMFSRFFLPPNDSRRTDLLIGTPQQDRLGIGPQVASFAYQRDGGGRGFVYGGVDFHDNMQNETYRRFLLNGIAWAAGLEVPDGGVQSPAPAPVQP